MHQESYEIKEFDLSGLNGISDRTLEMHINLYKGYVKNTNLLKEQLADLIQKKKVSASDSVYSELKRHLGFEYGGMILHEYYFRNLSPNGKGKPSEVFLQKLQGSFGSFEVWKKDFIAVGNLRGVGWAILFQDPETGWLSNHWVMLHAQGVPSGLIPILVMDMWEHAYLLDFKPSEKDKYIDAFFQMSIGPL